MKKIIKDWKFVFLVSVFLLLLCFFITLCSSEAASPSKGWSRAVRIAEIDNTMVKDFKFVRVNTLPIVSDNTFVTFWQTGNMLNYQTTSSQGAVIDKGEVNYKFPVFDDINSKILNGNIEFFGLSDSGLTKYVIDLKNHRVVSDDLIDKDAKNFLVKNNMVVYSTKSSIKLLDEKDNEHTVDNVASEYLDAADDSGIFYINYVVVKPQVSIGLNYAAYDYRNEKIKLYHGMDITIMHSSSFAGASFNIENGNVANLVVFRDWDSGNTSTSNFTFRLGNEKRPKSYDLDISGYNPNPMILKSSNNYLEYMAATDNYRSYKTSYENLAVITMENEQTTGMKFLTKTNGISKEPKIFTLGNDTYLQWEDVSASSKTINFASTNKNVIGKAKHLQINELGDILINTLFGAAWGGSFMLLFIAAVTLPALLLIVLFAMFALRWLENNNRKVLNACIGIQFIAKIVITFSLGTILSKIKLLLPAFLQYSPGLFLVIALTTVIAAYCVKVKYKKDIQNRSIFELFIVFALMDFALYSLIYYPYYSL